jgi:hypothetical protein
MLRFTEDAKDEDSRKSFVEKSHKRLIRSSPMDIERQELPGGDTTQRKLVMVARFPDLVGAEVARSALESAGIPVYLWDDNVVRIYGHAANIVGGIRLNVDAENEGAAREMLNQSTPNAIAFDTGKEFLQPKCPTCGASDISLGQFYGVSDPTPAGSDIWRCNACDECWEETED